MKKKIIVAVVAAGMVAVIAGGIFLFKNMNALVAAAIEKYGSNATGTRVAVSGVEISLREGRGSVNDLRIGNPQEFTARDAFTLGDITIDIDIGSVRDNPVVIDEVRIQAPVVYAEINSTGGTNIDVLRQRVGAHSSGTEDGGGIDKKIRIKTFVFEAGKIEFDGTALGLGKRELVLPEIRLSDVGGAGGASPDELSKVILTSFAGKVTGQIARSEIDGLVKDKLGKSLSGKAKKLLNKITN